MSRLRYGAALVSAAAFAACGKGGIQDITGTVPGARVQFFNYGVGAPGVNFYANDTKVTAISSSSGTESTIGTGYGSAAAGGWYSGIAPGQYTLSGRIAATSDKDLPIATLPATLADSKNYSFYLSGIYDAKAKKVDAFVVEDVYPDTINYQVALVRFVNAISNAKPLRLYGKRTDVGVEGYISDTVAYKGASPFIQLPEGVYDLSARYPGSTTSVITNKGVSLSAGRVYTVNARGDMTVTSSTAANRPILDNTANR